MIDMQTATPAEVIAEAARRKRNVEAGRNPTDDGNETASGILARRAQPDRLVPPPSRTALDQFEAVVRRSVAIAADTYVAEANPLGVRYIVLPWSVLCPDNAKYCPGQRHHRGGTRAALVLTPRYRCCRRDAIRSVIEQLAAMGSGPPLRGRCTLLAVLYEPDRRTRRDISNYAKLVHDVLSTRVYVDDHQLDHVRWIRGAPDIDRPRLEIVVQEASHG